MLHIYVIHEPVMTAQTLRKTKHGLTSLCWICTFPQRDKRRAKARRAQIKVCALSL